MPPPLASSSSSPSNIVAVSGGRPLSPAQASASSPHAARGLMKKLQVESSPKHTPTPTHAPRHRAQQLSSPDSLGAVAPAAPEGELNSTPARKRRRTASAGSETSAASPSQSAGRDEPQTKGAWVGAAIFIALSHVFIAAYAALYISNRFSAAPFADPLYSVSWRMLGLTWLTAWLNLLGITAGYHRLWSHNSYKAAMPLKIFLAIIGLGSFQGSARWWVQKHRLHHRYTDTPNDPYDSTKGLLYSHIGWLFEPPPYFPKQRLISMKDLDEDVVVEFQKRHLLAGYFVFGLLVPGLIGVWSEGSFFVGALWIGAIGRFLSWHAIWTINSLSHYEGIREFSTASTAVYCFVVNLVQNGEGHHNYHHAFPKDFRHGHRWYEWDPTKWFVMLCAAVGLAYDLETVDTNEVQQGQVQVLEASAAAMRAAIKWGPTDEELPSIDEEAWQRMAQRCKGSKVLIRLNSYVLDVSAFSDHPGGRHFLTANHGCDVTEAFEGGITLHTQAAHSRAAMFRCARIV